MRKFVKLTATFFIALTLQAIPLQPAGASDLVVVTSADNVEQLDLEDVARIFLGKVTRYPSGNEVVPVNMDSADPGFAEFARIVLKKTPSQLKAYWAKRVFTGKGKPPRSIVSAGELRALVASDSRYLSYLDRRDVDRTLRLVIELRQ